MNLLYKLYFVRENNFKILTRCKLVSLSKLLFFFFYLVLKLNVYFFHCFRYNTLREREMLHSVNLFAMNPC